jgi:hypothetical protein
VDSEAWVSGIPAVESSVTDRTHWYTGAFDPEHGVRGRVGPVTVLATGPIHTIQ